MRDCTLKCCTVKTLGVCSGLAGNSDGPIVAFTQGQKEIDVTHHTFPVHVRSRWLDYSPALHNHARTRVDAALRAHATRVQWVKVRLTGGDGAPEERICEIEVTMKPDGLLTVSASDVDAYRATDAAIRRARTAVRRHVDRAREELRRAA